MDTELNEKSFRARNALSIIALALTILINSAMIAGGLKWFVWANNTIERVSAIQERVLIRLDEFDKWRIQEDKRHAIEDALKTQEQKSIR